jgi:hypothetical protein
MPDDIEAALDCALDRIKFDGWEHEHALKYAARAYNVHHAMLTAAYNAR